METRKNFDCVEMKNHIQSDLLKQWRGLSDKQIEAQISKDLATSNSSSAKLWRKVRKTTAPARTVPHH